MKALLLDADGVVLAKGEYFSERFAREYGIPLSDILPFFKGPLVACQRGDADLKEELLPYLRQWKWEGGVDAFLAYWFTSDVVVAPGIERSAAAFRAKGVGCYLASNNEKYRAEVIMQTVRERNLLDGFYFSHAIRSRKENPEFFQYVLQDLSLPPEEVHFVDNDQKNIDAALQLGVRAHLYTDAVLPALLEKM